MANQGDAIDSLLVRLGLETDEQDFQKANSLFNRVRTTALQFGAVIGAGLGVQGLTFGFARAKDELGKFADVFGVSAQFVDSLGYALKQSGGNAEDAFGSIERIRNLIESTEWGELPSDAFRVAGFDPMLLQGVTSVAEAYERLSAATSDLTPEDARRALSSLGFGQSEITLFRGRGADSFASLIAEGQRYARVTEEMTDQAARFQSSLTNLTKSLDGLGNEISTLFLDDLSEFMQGAADLLRDNRDETASLLRSALPWLEATAVGVGTLVAMQGGRALLGKLGGMAGMAGKAGIVGTVALGYQFLQENPDYVDDAKAASDEWLRNTAGDLGEATGVEWLKEKGRLPEQYRGEPGYGSEIPGWEDIPVPQAPVIRQGDNHFTIDARGSTDPAATEEAARRGAEAALERAAKNTVSDLRTPVK